MSSGIDYALGKKIRVLLAAIDRGAIAPDPFELLWAAHQLEALHEPQLARECERVARRLLPHLARNLS